MLESLLTSLDGVLYPIVVVINDSDNAPSGYFKQLYDITVGNVKTISAPRNGYDPQVMQVIYELTDYIEWVHLHDTMIIKRLDLFDLFFKTYAGRSVSFFHNYMNFIGKFVRKDLTNSFIPITYTKWGAVMTELTWGPLYHIGSNAVTLFPNLYHESSIFQEINNKRVMVVENEYFIKYKHHWTLDSVSGDRIL